MNLESIQQELRALELDGWLFFDHHERDPLAYRILGFKPARHVTRRWYYWIPASGQPVALTHRIEAGMLDTLPGEIRHYCGWREQHEALGATLSGCRRVAMQYSPLCAIPYVSLVDAGTVELVRSFGIDVAGSADLVQMFEARWTAEAHASHLEAGRRIDRIRAAAFHFAADGVHGAGIDEHGVQRFIREAFDREGLFTDHGPIVAVNANASNPHYEPTAEVSTPIRAGELLLIDLWAKLKQPGSTYYDITWTAVCAGEPTERMQRIFAIVREARDRAVRTVTEAVAEGRALRGFEVDDAARGYIAEQGYGQYFTHRTGHSIGEDVHGAGANMDHLETRDERRIISRTCFSVEPGIYLEDFGIRSEVNVYVGDDAAGVTGDVQTELTRIG